jgi:hypothetical protein
MSFFHCLRLSKHQSKCEAFCKNSNFIKFMTRSCEPLAEHKKLEDHPFTAARDCLLIAFAATLRTGGRNLYPQPEEEGQVCTSCGTWRITRSQNTRESNSNNRSADSFCIVRGRKMCAQSDKQTLKRNTPENSEHVDIPFRRIRHVARTMAAKVKGFQRWSTCKTSGHKGADRGIMELEMEKLIGKKRGNECC